MAIANPRIHIICGICGSNKDFSFKIAKEISDDDGSEISVVYVKCNNCSSLTDLDEIIPKEKKIIKLI